MCFHLSLGHPRMMWHTSILTHTSKGEVKQKRLTVRAIIYIFSWDIVIWSRWIHKLKFNYIASSFFFFHKRINETGMYRLNFRRWRNISPVTWEIVTTKQIQSMYASLSLKTKFWMTYLPWIYTCITYFTLPCYLSTILHESIFALQL